MPEDARPAPPAETVRIRFLKATACEVHDGPAIDHKPGEELDVPKRAADYLISKHLAELTPP